MSMHSEYYRQMQSYIRMHKENQKAKEADGPELKDILQSNVSKVMETEVQETLETKILETEIEEQPTIPIKKSKKFDPKDFVSKEFMIKKLEYDNLEAENVRKDEETFIK